MPGCCLYPALLPKLCIFACVLNLWHCARLLPLSYVVTHALYFCLCPLILPVSYVAPVFGCQTCPFTYSLVQTWCDTEHGGGCTDCSAIADFTSRCAVPFTRRRHVCLSRVLTNKHTCNLHVSKSRSTSLTRISRFSCVY